jgi:class 3 adenylate cyclase
LLEFTGDAILAQFLKTNYSCDVAQAVRAGLRMHRAMSQFQPIETPNGQFNLTMRVGIHCGSFLAADLGSPLRMSRVLLGQTVREAKRAEGRGQVGRVCLTQGAIDHLQEPFQLEPHDPYYLVIDDSQEGNLGEYEIGVGKRLAAPLLLDRSPEALLEAIVTLLNQIEPLACYQSESVLRLLVEYAAERQIPPDLSDATVVFVSLIGLAGRVDQANPQEQEALVRTFSRLFASIHATVYAHGGILHRVTYHIQGSDILIYFGVPNAHNHDSIRAALAALAIRDQIRAAPPLTFQTEQVQFECKIGITKGRVFIGEVGEPRSRREYNILGDVVNTAARLMTQAESNQILMTTAVHQALQTEALLSTNAPEFTYQFLGEFLLKGKSSPVAIYTLQGQSN